MSYPPRAGSSRAGTDNPRRILLAMLIITILIVLLQAALLWRFLV